MKVYYVLTKYETGKTGVALFSTLEKANEHATNKVVEWMDMNCWRYDKGHIREGIEDGKFSVAGMVVEIEEAYVE